MDEPFSDFEIFVCDKLGVLTVEQMFGKQKNDCV